MAKIVARDQVVRIGVDLAKRWFSDSRSRTATNREFLNRKLPRDKVLGFWLRFQLAIASGQIYAYATPSGNGRYLRQADLSDEMENLRFGSN